MKNILVIADPKGGTNSALKRALHLKAQTKAKITLLGFGYASVQNPDDLKAAKLSRKQLEKFVLSKRTDEIADALKSLKIDKKTLNVKVMWGKDISKAICAYCNNHPVDMVIKSGNRSETFLYTSTDWQLFRDCSAPVMITSGKSWKKKPRVFAALDFASTVKSKQSLNTKIIEQAKAMAAHLDEELHIGFALTIPEPLADMDLINPKKYANEKRKKLQPAIDKFCQAHKIDPENVHIKLGRPEKVIPSLANNIKADIVVAGTVGRKGVKGKLIGNTVENILRNLRTDILAVKP